MYFEIDNVELRVASEHILKGIYLKAETGKITGILGANGCGKSSLLSILFGSLSPNHKLIRIDSKPYLKPLFTYNIVKLLPQASFIPSHLKITTVFKLFGVSWTEFIADFDSFSTYANSTVREISGGERRLIEAYLIIKSKADLVLLDEPFTHLSPIYIEKFTKILKKETKNKAVVMTDHLYHHIIDLADDLYFLTNGCTQLIKDPVELENLKYLSSGTVS
ncbi:MAG TPA: ABC transporter ATP-binding protein [Gillisia sp.]|nr:ABC transporter ATP-binding protein [Gillisia sp.]